ncbi:MAG: hypothetical protein HHAS10_11640 [Candidatus Altimarinota bacterium]
MLARGLGQIYEGRVEYRHFIQEKFPNIQGKVREILLTHASFRAGIGYWTGDVSSKLYGVPENKRKGIKLAAMLFGIVMRNIDNLTDNEYSELAVEHKREILKHFLLLLSGETSEMLYFDTPHLHELELLAFEFHKLIGENSDLCDTLKRLESVVRNQLIMEGGSFDDWVNIARDTGGNTSTMTIGFGQFFGTGDHESLNAAVFQLGSWMQVYDDIIDRNDDRRRGQKTFATEFPEFELKGLEQDFRNRVLLALDGINPNQKETIKNLMKIFRTLNWINSHSRIRRTLGRNFPEIIIPSASS